LLAQFFLSQQRAEELAQEREAQLHLAIQIEKAKMSFGCQILP
jgi:hypothetical protein